MLSTAMIILLMTLSVLYINMFSNMATNSKIGYSVIILVMFYIILVIKKQYDKYYESHKLFLTEPHDATKSIVISKNKLPKMNEGSEFSYVFWIFIKDWEYNYSKPKCVMYNGDKEGNQANPSIWLYPKENKLMVRFNTISDDGVKSSMNPIKNIENINTLSSYPVCDVDNIPLQRWVHVGVTMWNKTSDVYINGKLIRSCVLPEVPKMGNNNLYITQFGGFNGQISKVSVINKALNPNAIYDMYQKGPYHFDILKNLFGNINIDVSINSDDTEIISGEITV